MGEGKVGGERIKIKRKRREGGGEGRGIGSIGNYGRDEARRRDGTRDMEGRAREEKGKEIEIGLEKYEYGKERRGERKELEEWMGDGRRGKGGVEDEEEDGRCW